MTRIRSRAVPAADRSRACSACSPSHGLRSASGRPMSMPRRSPSWRRARWSRCRCRSSRIWGLRGLTALDPDLTADTAADGSCGSSTRDRSAWPRDRRRPTTTSTAGATAAAQLASAGRGGVAAGAARRHAGRSCRASSTSCSTTSIRIRATCRRARPVRTANVASARPAPACSWSSAVRSSFVAEVVADGPGALAGIRPGDAIVAVDGQTTQGKDADTVVQIGSPGRRRPASWLTGAVATAAFATCGPGARAWCRRKRVVRAANRRHAGDAGHRLQPQHRQRIWRTPSSRALPARIHPSGIVLDLRGNRGGLLRQAVDGGRHAAARGRRRDHRRPRSRGQPRFWRSTRGDLADDIAGGRAGRRPLRQRRGDPGRGTGRPAAAPW